MSDFSSHTCSATGCSKPASQQCPTCVQLKLPPTHFCSQECFKAEWKTHNAVHKAERDRLNFIPPMFDYTGPLRPAYIYPRLTVPDHIPRPEYAETGLPKTEMEMRGNTTIHINTPDEIKRIKESCRLGREILDIAHGAIRPGITTDEIDRIVHAATIARNAYPSPLNYNNFPKSCCTSVNEVICHGIPDARPLQDGDIVNVDISCYYQGMHADLNETFVVGKVDDESKKLVKTTYEALMMAIQAVKPGAFCRDFGEIISKHCNKAGFSVVRSYCGHGVGELFHCAPNIPHYARNKAVGVLRPGMVFTIEPMINVGTWKDVLWTFDDWTSTTTDGKRSAQFEHTVLVTDKGCEILTARTPTSPPFFWEQDGKIDTTWGWNGNNQLTHQQSQKTTTTTQNENKEMKTDEDGDEDGEEDGTTKETGATGAAKKKKKKKKKAGAATTTTTTTTTPAPTSAAPSDS